MPAAHILDFELFGGQYLAQADQAIRLLVNELTAKVTDALMRLGNQTGQTPLPYRALALLGTLSLQVRR